MKLRLMKCSQYKKDAILWQVAPLAKTSALPEKFYLILSHHKEANQYLRFVRERPALQWEAGGAFAALVRKYLASAVISAIFVDAERRHIWLPLLSAGQEWFLHIHHEGAVAISLISPDKESLVRLGVKGVFTKKKSAELPLLENLENRLEDFLTCLGEKPGTQLAASAPPTQDLAISHYQREARRRLARRLKTVRQAFAKLHSAISSADTSALLEKQARHLQTFLYKVETHMSELRLLPEETGYAEVLVIPLQTQWSAAENLADYFERLKKMKKGQSALKEQIEKTGAELNALEAENTRLQHEALSEDELAKVLRRFRLPVDKPLATPVVDDKNTKPYRIFHCEGVEIWVGKGPRENDELTKAARSNDHWLHAIGLGGSHVLIPSQQLGKAGLSAKVKRDAAILALHFSRLRKDQAGEVYVTQRRCLTKKKGMPPGLWLVQQSETYFLTYTAEELKILLNS